jgi:hypothetical protein
MHEFVCGYLFPYIECIPQGLHLLLYLFCASHIQLFVSGSLQNSELEVEF